MPSLLPAERIRTAQATNETLPPQPSHLTPPRWTSASFAAQDAAMGALRDGGSGAAGDEVRAAGRRPDRLPGAGPRATRPGDDHRRLQPDRHHLGRPGDGPVSAESGLVLTADPVRPARYGRLRPAAGRSPASLGVLRRGTGGGHGRGWLPAGRAAGADRRRPAGAVLRRIQAGTDQRAHPGPHHGQVRRHRRLPHRGSHRGGPSRHCCAPRWRSTRAPSCR
jgi:hypothetical protein